MHISRLHYVYKLAGGVDAAADLVEYYCEVGYDHLVPAYAKYGWNWVTYYNIDVYTLVFVTGITILYLVYKLLSCLCFRCVCHS